MTTHPPIKLRIQTKGLLFILLPLVFQIVLFVQLMHLGEQSEELLVEEQRLFQMGQLDFDIAFNIGYAYMSLIERVSGPPRNYKLSPVKFLHDMTVKIQQLRELMKTIRTPVRDVTREVEAQAKEVYKLLAVPDSEVRAKTELNLPVLVASERRVEMSYRRLVELKRMNDAALDEINRFREKNALKRQALKDQLNIGLVVEIAMTIFLLSVFLSDITKRLSLLVRNAQLLPTGENFPKRVSGNDELAYLDSVLHTASDELRKAAEHRQSITHMVAHDLRSPLASMKLGLKLLLDDQPQETRAERVQALIRSASKLNTLVENLLTVDKVQSAALEVESELIDFAQIVANAVETLAAKADEKKVKLVHQIDKTVALGDAAKLEQVLTNLLSNAIKYSPEGQEVVISSENRPREVVISVRDQGPGIALDKQEDIFKKGVQVDPLTKSQGFGLGLAISKQIVTAHAGRIGVHSEPGKGSTFWFSIPADNEPD